jgi:hypothetical protein
MKKLIFFVSLLLGSANSEAQLKLDPTIHIGVGFRFPPWFIESKAFTVNPYDFQYSYHDRKVRLVLDIKQSLLKNKRLNAQFSNNLTYTEFRKVKADNSNTYISDKTLKRDHFLDLLYTIIPSKNNGGLIVGLGFGYMNCGTKFYFIKNDTSSSSPNTQQRRKGTMRYLSPRLILGYEKKPFSIYAMISTPPDNEGEKRATIMMDLKLVYGFKVLKKEKTIKVFDR